MRNSTSASCKSGASLWPSKFEEPLHAISPLGDSHTHEHGKDSATETCIYIFFLFLFFFNFLNVLFLFFYFLLFFKFYFIFKLYNNCISFAKYQNESATGIRDMYIFIISLSLITSSESGVL